jgi:hypothetical protein
MLHQIVTNVNSQGEPKQVQGSRLQGAAEGARQRRKFNQFLRTL